MSLECGKNRERTCKLHTEMSQSGFKPRTFLRKSIVLTTAPLFMSTFNKKQLPSKEITNMLMSPSNISQNTYYLYRYSVLQNSPALSSL